MWPEFPLLARCMTPLKISIQKNALQYLWKHSAPCRPRWIIDFRAPSWPSENGWVVFKVDNFRNQSRLYICNNDVLYYWGDQVPEGRRKLLLKAISSWIRPCFPSVQGPQQYIVTLLSFIEGSATEVDLQTNPWPCNIWTTIGRFEKRWRGMSRGGVLLATTSLKEWWGLRSLRCI